MKALLIIWLFVVSVMCLVPPWQERIHGPTGHDSGIVTARLCAPVFHPPEIEKRGCFLGVFSIDYRQLGIQLLGVTALAGALLIVLPLGPRIWARIKGRVIVASVVLVVIVVGGSLAMGLVWLLNKFPLIVYVVVGVLVVGASLLFAAAIGQWVFRLARQLYFRWVSHRPAVYKQS